MKWNGYYGWIGLIITGLFVAYAMVQPKMSSYDLMMYGFVTVFVWVRMVVIILIVTWGYKYFKKINGIK